MSGFWARALGAQSAPARPQLPAPAYAPAPAAAHYAPQQVPVPVQAVHPHYDAGLCPNCSSGDYVKGVGMNRPRCYSCGYPVLHSTSGAVATNRKKAAPARQTEMSREGGYNPHMIVGRIE